MNVNNRSAFLYMLAISEGTQGIGDRGYNALVGGSTFSNYAAHPDVLVNLPRRNNTPLKSTAAGRYQFIHSTWLDLATKLGLKDFSPASQDVACMELVRECGALDDVDAGRISVAISKCSHIWASLPGAGYGQHENVLASLLATFTQAGGVLT